MSMHFQEEKPAGAVNTPKLRIVVADDNAAYLNEICDLLEKHYEVVAQAINGLECVEAVQRLSPSIVVTDVSMPKMNGIEAARKITKRSPDVKVVILSAYDDPAFVEAALDAGASAYVTKIFALEELIPAIEAVVAGRSCFPAFK
jgi:DNA-binding NarL/FixJ family response regulator